MKTILIVFVNLTMVLLSSSSFDYYFPELDYYSELESTNMLQCNGSKFTDFDLSFEDMDGYIIHDGKEHGFVSYGCMQTTSISFSVILEENGINTSLTKRASIYIDPTSNSNTYDLDSKNFEGLSLKFLDINYKAHEDIKGRPKPGFLEPLSELIVLRVSNALLPPMPLNSKLGNLNLNNGESLGEFGGCADLQMLELYRWGVLQDYWLASCPNITEIVMQEVSPQSVINILHGATSVRRATAKRCNIYNLPTNVFDGMKSMEFLDLGENFIYKKDEITELLLKLPKLKTLNLDDNIALNLCTTSLDHSHQPASHPGLKTISLSNTATDIECLDERNLPALEELIMERQNFHVLQLNELVRWRAPMKIHISGAISQVSFIKSNYETLRKSKANITIFGTIVLERCDCYNYNLYLARAIKEKLLIFASNSHEYALRCKDMNDINLEISPDTTGCSKYDCGLHGRCVCRQKWLTEDVLSQDIEADCRSSGITQIPFENRLQKLLAHNNQIKLRAEDIPDSLIYLDLTHNYISSMEEDVVRKLFANENRQIRLSDNPIACNCNNTNFIKAIQLHQKQVLDYDNITCAGEEKLLRNIKISELCEVLNNFSLIASLTICGVLLAIIVFALILNYTFGQEIRVFLYARGWCLFCVKETEDNERTYDAFVSFCHEDEELVCQELIPKLEEFGYKLCIHHRDWVPGELIPTQIIRSIEESRKTLIVLSKKFASSLWGSLEFKAAHARALKEGVARVILIVLDDVINSQVLDRDILSYIRTNTYVKWDDPWFWDKIQYAMRQRTKQRRRKVEIEIQTSINPGVILSPRKELQAEESKCKINT